MNGNNNDKKSFPNSYPLILTKSHASMEQHQPSQSSSEKESNDQLSEITDTNSVQDGQGESPGDNAMLGEGSSKTVKRQKRKRPENLSPADSEPSGQKKKIAKPNGKSIDDSPSSPSIERKRRGRRDKSRVEVKTKEPSFTSPTTYVKVQGAYFKVCPNCKTVANKAKAKKCHNCQNFFYNHWAQRCRIPPCPKCLFSRRSKPNEVVPKKCEKCGHPLPIPNTSKKGPTKSTKARALPVSSIALDESSQDSFTMEESLTAEMEVSEVKDGNLNDESAAKVISEASTIVPTSSAQAVNDIASVSGLTVSERSAFTRVKTRRRKQVFPDEVTSQKSISPPPQTKSPTLQELLPSEDDNGAVTRSGKVYKQDSVSPTVLLEDSNLEEQGSSANKSTVSPLLFEDDSATEPEPSVEAINGNTDNIVCGFDPQKPIGVQSFGRKEQSPSEQYFRTNYGADLETIETAEHANGTHKIVENVLGVVREEEKERDCGTQTSHATGVLQHDNFQTKEVLHENISQTSQAKEELQESSEKHLPCQSDGNSAIMKESEDIPVKREGKEVESPIQTSRHHEDYELSTESLAPVPDTGATTKDESQLTVISEANANEPNLHRDAHLSREEHCKLESTQHHFISVAVPHSSAENQTYKNSPVVVTSGALLSSNASSMPLSSNASGLPLSSNASYLPISSNASYLPISSTTYTVPLHYGMYCSTIPLTSIASSMPISSIAPNMLVPNTVPKVTDAETAVSSTEKKTPTQGHNNKPVKIKSKKKSTKADKNSHSIKSILTQQIPPVIPSSVMENPSVTKPLLQCSEKMDTSTSTNPLLRELIKSSTYSTQEQCQIQADPMTAEQPSTMKKLLSSTKQANKSDGERDSIDEQKTGDDTGRYVLPPQQPDVKHLIDQLQTKVQQQQKELETKLRQRLELQTQLAGTMKSESKFTASDSKSFPTSPVNVSDVNPAYSEKVHPLSVFASQLNLISSTQLNLKTLLVPTVLPVSASDSPSPPSDSSCAVISRPSVITSASVKSNVIQNTLDPGSLQTCTSTGKIESPVKQVPLGTERVSAAKSVSTSLASPIIFHPQLTASLFQFLPPSTAGGLLQQSNPPALPLPFQQTPSKKSTPITTSTPSESTSSTITANTTSATAAVTNTTDVSTNTAKVHSIATSDAKMNTAVATTTMSTTVGTNTDTTTASISSMLSSVGSVTRHVGTSTSPCPLHDQKKTIQPAEERPNLNTTTTNLNPIVVDDFSKPTTVVKSTSKSPEHTSGSCDLQGFRTSTSAHESEIYFSEQNTASKDSTSPGRFEKLELKPSQNASNKIRVSLLKPADSSAGAATPSNVFSVSQSAAIHPSSHIPTGVSAPPMSAVGSFGGKFQNFAVSPNLSVIATVETQRHTLTKPNTQIMPKLAPSTSKQAIPTSTGKQPLGGEAQCVPATSLASISTPQESHVICHPKSLPAPPPLRSLVSGSVHATVVSTSLPQPPNPVSYTSQAPHGSIVDLASNIQQRISKALSQGDSAPPLAISASNPTSSQIVSSEPPQNKSTQSTQIFSNAGAQTSNSSTNKGLGGSLAGLKLPICTTFGTFGSTLSGKTVVSNDSNNSTKTTVSEVSSTTRLKPIAPNVGRVFRNPGGGMVTITVCNGNVPPTIPSSSSVGVSTGPAMCIAGGVVVTPLKGVQYSMPKPGSIPQGTVTVTPLPSTQVQIAGKTGLREEGVQTSATKPFGGTTSSRGTMTRQVIASTLPSSHQIVATSPHTSASVATGHSSCDYDDSVPVNDQISSRTRSRESSAKRVKVEVLPREFDESYCKLMSAETLESSPSKSGSPGDVTSVEKETTGGGDGNGRGDGENCEDGDGGEGGEDGDGERREEKGEGGDREEGTGGEGDGFKKHKKKKSSKEGKKMKLQLYSVKLKDCFLHHLMWKDYRVVLLVPISTSPKMDSISSPDKSKTGEQSANNDLLATPPNTERRSKRKPKHEPLVIHEIEEEELDCLESPCTSSAHINSPCFSVYELRHKMFSEYASNAVYAYTYKNQIKSLKPPIHWVHVLKRMGGMQETCHTCRLLDIDNVKGMSEHYGDVSSLPSTLDELCRNELPKGRKVIDLSDVEPEEITDSNATLEKIPQCSFMEKPHKKKGSSKRKRKLEEMSSSKKLCLEEPVVGEKSQDIDCTANEYQGAMDFEEHERHIDHHDGVEVPKDFSTVRRSPPPLIKHDSLSHDENILSKPPLKKKYCPDCGNQIARKCKKCPSCGKRFGVYTFGRKLCPSCSRVNLARMSACYECGYSMQNAVEAVPKQEDEPSHDSKSKFLFGYRKRRRVHSLPDSSSDYESRYGDVKMDHLLLSSGHPSSSDITDSMEFSEIVHDGGTKEVEEPLSAGLGSSGEGTQTAKAKSKHTGYQYGRVPWGDADITCLVDENGVCKFCLQELCTKVLQTHTKSDVFDIVKSLKLPVQQGDNTLLKKLQALGLHSNRSPICRLIAAEELWTLLDALQEPVPEEVHQHLENISASTTPLMSPTQTSALQSPGLVASNTTAPTTATTVVDEDEHGFESTLHEVQCSDGQYVSILQTWNGEQYACLTEIWRKYFPEVNRNHLTSALKRLALETHMPTGQQATLLRSAGVISLRGAAGRLMKLESMQTLLDDFSIPLQIGIQENGKPKERPALPRPHPTTQTHPATKSRRVSNYGLPTNNATAAAKTIPHDKVLATKEDMLHAACMRNILQAVDHSDLQQLLERSRDVAETLSVSVDEEVQAAATEFDSIQQLMHSRRELCNILSDEIGYLTVTNHSFMAQLVRVNHTGRQTIQDVEHMLHTFDFTLE